MAAGTSPRCRLDLRCSTLWNVSAVSREEPQSTWVKLWDVDRRGTLRLNAPPANLDPNAQLATALSDSENSRGAEPFPLKLPASVPRQGITASCHAARSGRRRRAALCLQTAAGKLRFVGPETWRTARSRCRIFVHTLCTRRCSRPPPQCPLDGACAKPVVDHVVAARYPYCDDAGCVPAEQMPAGQVVPSRGRGRTSEAVQTAQLNTRKHDCRTQTDCLGADPPSLRFCALRGGALTCSSGTVSAPDPAVTRRPPAHASRTVIRYPGTPANLAAEPPPTITSAPGPGDPVQVDMQRLGASPTVAVGDPNTMAIPAIPSPLQACSTHGQERHETAPRTSHGLCRPSVSGASRGHSS